MLQTREFTNETTVCIGLYDIKHCTEKKQKPMLHTKKKRGKKVKLK